MYVSLAISIYLSLYLFIHLPTYLPSYLFIYICIHLASFREAGFAPPYGGAWMWLLFARVALEGRD